MELQQILPVPVLRVVVLVICASLAAAADDYFPPPDSQGGWRSPGSPEEARREAGVDTAKLDEAFEYLKQVTKHGGLLVARRGWLVYERYFGRAHREANPNNASIGKSYTSIMVGILMAERPDLFPQGLDQKVFTRKFYPSETFPLSDPGKANIKLGQLLAMTAGIRGNNPGYVRHREVQLDPAGPDGWEAVVDDNALGKTGGKLNARMLWCKPGEGYSYATSSVQLASIMLRHVAGMELEEYVRRKIAGPLGWGRWGWGYKNRLPVHTAGGGGIAPRPPDMLRFAYLLLRGGRWRDRQVVPAEYVAKCGRLSPYNPHFDYSLQFDVNGNGRWPDVPRDAFWKTGSGGFAIYVIPSLDLVVYKIGGRDSQYDPADTKMDPAPASVFRYDGSREGWKMPVNAYPDTYERTIHLVLNAIVQ